MAGGALEKCIEINVRMPEQKLLKTPTISIEVYWYSEDVRGPWMYRNIVRSAIIWGT